MPVRQQRLTKHIHANTKRVPLYNRRGTRRRRRVRGGVSSPLSFSVYYGTQQVCQQKLRPDQVRTEPRLAFQPAPDTLYTVLMYDSNVARPDYLHWLVPNVRDPNRLFPAVPYSPPSPPAETGYHTYMFEVYEQPRGPLQMGVREMPRSGPDFNKDAFITSHGLRYAGRCGFYVEATAAAEKN